MSRSGACPLCGEATNRLFERHGHWIRECGACLHRSAEVDTGEGFLEAVYDDDYFFGGGAGYPDYLAQAAALRARGRRYARKLRRWTEPGYMLDVGAAAGFVLQGFVDEGWRGRGVEPNAGMVEHARREFGLDVVRGTLEELTVDEPFDLVTLIQVIAHVPDPRRTVEAVRDALRPGGLCLLETWDRKSWTARLLGQNWHEYSPPSVLHWFSRDSLRRLFEEHRLEHVAGGRPFRTVNGRHAKSLLDHKTRGVPGGALVRGLASLVPDRLSLPYPSEDLFWMLFRKP